MYGLREESREVSKEVVSRSVFGKLVLFGGLAFLEVMVQDVFREKGVGMMNQGVAFGIQFGGVFLVVVGLWFLLSLYLFIGMKFSGWWLLWTGGGANILSRLFFGGVWDYILVVPGLWFNGADVMIVVGVIERVYHYMKPQRPKRSEVCRQGRRIINASFILGLIGRGFTKPAKKTK